MIYSLVIDSIVIVLFHFLWLNDESRLILSFIEAVFISVILPLSQFAISTYDCKERLAFSLIFLNYGPFYAVNFIPYIIACGICKK